MSRLHWLLLSVVLLAGGYPSTGQTGAAGPMGPTGPQGEQGPPGSPPKITCAADQVLTYTATGWGCMSTAPLTVLRVRQGRKVDNASGFTALPVTDARIAVSCPTGWRLARVSCTSGIPTVTAAAHDHRQVVLAVNRSPLNGTKTVGVWIAAGNYALVSNNATGYFEIGRPFDAILPANAIDANGTSGTCTFNGTVDGGRQGQLFADGVCVNAPPAPTGPGTCDTSSNCPPL